LIEEIIKNALEETGILDKFCVKILINFLDVILITNEDPF
jgi:hypothetical protein